ncbi:hypothetical protein BJY01DRAFT_244782 [Aspergillus pseudoustus]|uniref:Uncharacterized protein n=1 Tax=Aspergillus pseudoustus TaxID=1810923 RepID=A0ABR4KIA9_9EURO
MESTQNSDAPKKKIPRVSAPERPISSLDPVPSRGDKDISSLDKDRLIRDLSDRLCQANENYDRLLVKYQASSVSDKEGKFRGLSDELHKASEAYNRLHEKHRACRLSSKFFKDSFPICWLNSDGGTWGRDLRDTCIAIDRWVYNYALNEIEDMDKFSKTDKQFTISSLGGYCAQEDVDYLIPRFTEPASYSAPVLFLSMFIIKDLVEQFYRNPFRYRGPDPVAAKHDTRKTQRQVDFAEDMYDLGMKFKKSKALGQDYEFGDSTSEYRESRIWSLVGEVLSKKTAQLLLKDPSKINPVDKAFEQLLKIYRRTAQEAINLSFWDVEPEIHNLDTIGSTFYLESESALVAWRHPVSFFS